MRAATVTVKVAARIRVLSSSLGFEGSGGGIPSGVDMLARVELDSESTKQSARTYCRSDTVFRTGEKVLGGGTGNITNSSHPFVWVREKEKTKKKAGEEKKGMRKRKEKHQRRKGNSIASKISVTLVD